MSITLGFILLGIIYILWKLFVDGWLFKIILFFAGWFGIYVFLYIHDIKSIAITVGQQHPVSFTWAAVIPTIICFLCLLFSRVSNE